jgi:hypothetical protein
VHFPKKVVETFCINTPDASQEKDSHKTQIMSLIDQNWDHLSPETRFAISSVIQAMIQQSESER